MVNCGELWRTVAVRETVAVDRMVGSVVRQETEPCGGWVDCGLPRHEPNRGGSVRSVRTGTVCGTVVNTKYTYVLPTRTTSRSICLVLKLFVYRCLASYGWMYGCIGMCDTFLYVCTFVPLS